MIELVNVTKSYWTAEDRKVIIKDASLTFPSGRSVALLGRNGAGKSTLLKMIAGSISFDRGEIIRTGSISWPIGFAGSFHPELTGAQNTRFLARVYGVDTDELVAFTRDFADLGHHFEMPFRTYSSGMRSRLAFGVSMGVPFDTYLVDEVTSVGDALFKRKSGAVFDARMETAGAIVVSHSMHTLREMCDSGVVLHQGRAEFYEDIDDAIDRYSMSILGKPAKKKRTPA
ncbi:MAG: ABC transporter ATP-binding protein [Gammaproteobacteria bacterium]|nr:ABC transporter ATP-binding protein [Gammaproteobacteria bacterium]